MLTALETAVSFKCLPSQSNQEHHLLSLSHHGLIHLLSLPINDKRKDMMAQKEKEKI